MGRACEWMKWSDAICVKNVGNTNEANCVLRERSGGDVCLTTSGNINASCLRKKWGDAISAWLFVL